MLRDAGTSTSKVKLNEPVGSVFYSIEVVEDGTAMVDKDGLALEYVGDSGFQPTGNLSRCDVSPFGIKIADCNGGESEVGAVEPRDDRGLLAIPLCLPKLSSTELRHWRSMPAGGGVMQAALSDEPSTQTCERYDLSVVARQYLEHHPHFRGRMSDVFIEHRGRTLELTGKLPTFYLKQLVQEAVRHVPGVHNVRNMIDVVSASGVSSVRC